MAWDYSEKLRDHFFNPRNVGKLDDPDAVGEVGSIACGDALSLYLKIDKETERIVEAKFQTFGCGSAIASASALTEMIKDKTLGEVGQITNQDIAEYLDGMPPEKMHCSVMGREALEAAIASYRGIDIAPKEEEEGRIVCHCFGVTDKKIMRVVEENNLTSLEQVTNYTKAGGGCASCHAEIEELIEKVWKEKKTKEPEKPAPKKKLTNLQKILLIQETINNEIRPQMVAHGGDIELIDIEGNEVHICFVGHCLDCKASYFTIKAIEATLREHVSEDIVIVERKVDDLSSPCFPAKEQAGDRG